MTANVTLTGPVLAEGTVHVDSKRRRPDLGEIVLVGGDGTRLGSLTEALHGRPVPKQFASVAGDRSMLQATLDRIAPLVPARRTVVVIGRSHLPWARTQLADQCGVRQGSAIAG